MYLIVVDAFSKWPEVVILDTITTSKTIDARREMFARWGLRSLYQHAPAAYIASICSAGFGSETNLHLCSAVADFNSAVPPDKALQIHSLLSASLVSQKEISSTLDTCMFNPLLETSSTADQARLPSVFHTTCILLAVCSTITGAGSTS